MKRAGVAAVVVCALFPALTLAKTVVHMTDRGFVPDVIMIRVGDSIVFRNTGMDDHWPASNPHPVHTTYADFDAQHPILPGESWNFTFTRLGTWLFHDHLFPAHSATIVVGKDTVASSTTVSQNAPTLTLWARFVRLITLWWNTITARETAGTPLFAHVDPSAVEVDVLYMDWKFPCADSDFTCASGVLTQVVSLHGPRVATAFLKRLQKEKKILLSVDDHQLAHRMGRETAHSFGENGGAFRMCPMSDFNGGCQHGFFEYVLGRTKTTADAAEKICGPMKETSSAKVYFDCYHGVGHGVMMAKAYDLPASLAICDSLSDPRGQDGCSQGVFMENVNGAVQGTARPGVFSNTDPLLPCTTLDKKYQHECFINQFGWLIRVTGNSVAKAARACLAAPSAEQNTCLQSIGLAATNPSWQSSLAADSGDEAANAWRICQEFPAEHIAQCIIGAIDNLMNFDQFDTARSAALCATISPSMRDSCYYQIGVNIQRQAVGSTDRAAVCGPLSGKDACLKGAGITL